MVSPSAKRRAVRMIVEGGLGKIAEDVVQLRWTGLALTGPGGKSREQAIAKEILDLSAHHPRFGYRRITALLKEMVGKATPSVCNGKTPGRFRRKETTATNEARGYLNLRKESVDMGQRRLELGFRRRPNREWNSVEDIDVDRWI